MVSSEDVKLLSWNDGSAQPTPEELLELLLNGESAKINQHFVVYDRENCVVWYTNPYGIDGVLCHEPTIEAMRVFLARMARDQDYGLTPD